MYVDHVQVRYSRPSDGKRFSYRCRLSGDLILVWDDSLSNARWYGDLASDAKIKFQVEGDGVLIRQESVLGTVIEKKFMLSEVGSP